MTYWWSHVIADIGDWYPGGVVGMALSLLVLGVVVGLLSQPAGTFRFDFRRLRRSRKEPSEAPVITIADDDLESESLPDLPVDELAARAEAYMRRGEYRLAVREWLRVIVRDLVERGVIISVPGWTVTELADKAGGTLPAARISLSQAANIFSEIWYGGRTADHQAAAQLKQIRAEIEVTASTSAHVQYATAETA